MKKYIDEKFKELSVPSERRSEQCRRSSGDVFLAERVGIEQRSVGHENSHVIVVESSVTGHAIAALEVSQRTIAAHSA
jgi:hypothetical protein